MEQMGTELLRKTRQTLSVFKNGKGKRRQNKKPLPFLKPRRLNTAVPLIALAKSGQMFEASKTCEV